LIVEADADDDDELDVGPEVGTKPAAHADDGQTIHGPKLIAKFSVVILLMSALTAMRLR